MVSRKPILVGPRAFLTSTFESHSRRGDSFHNLKRNLRSSNYGLILMVDCGISALDIYDRCLTMRDL